MLGESCPHLPVPIGAGTRRGLLHGPLLTVLVSEIGAQPYRQLVARKRRQIGPVGLRREQLLWWERLRAVVVGDIHLTGVVHYQ